MDGWSVAYCRPSLPRAIQSSQEARAQFFLFRGEGLKGHIIDIRLLRIEIEERGKWEVV